MKLLVFFLASLLPLAAAPDWLEDVNIPRKAALDEIPQSQLTYAMTWNGRVKAGSFKVLFGEKDPRYPKHFLVRAYGGSTGWAHALFPYRFNYTSFLHPRTRRPIMFVGSETGKNEADALSYKFNSQGVTGTKTNTGNGKTKTEETRFAYAHSLDLFGGLLQIRSMPLKTGDKVIMPFHPIASPYLAKVEVLGREGHLGRKCIKLDIALQKIDDDLSLKDYRKLKKATLWLSDDEWRIPIEINAKVFVGHVRVLLAGHERL